MTRKKNKLVPLKQAVLVLALASLLLSGSAFAASQSVSVQVSCSIVPMMEIAAAPSAVQANTNLGRQYQMSETLVERGAQTVKVYSLTAL